MESQPEFSGKPKSPRKNDVKAMKQHWGITVALVVLAFNHPLCLPAHAAQWQANEQIKPYSISGKTSRELYRSIGKNGPRIGDGRKTIAHTTFDLKWRRNYKPRGNSCVLVSAKPFMTIIYTMPKPRLKLREPTASQWKHFYNGILIHEKVHGTYARELVERIIKTTVGLTVKNDRKCQKIRAEVLTRVKAAYGEYGARSGKFDRAEMTTGGNVRGLVNVLLRGE